MDPTKDRPSQRNPKNVPPLIIHIHVHIQLDGSGKKSSIPPLSFSFIVLHLHNAVLGKILVRDPLFPIILVTLSQGSCPSLPVVKLLHRLLGSIYPPPRKAGSTPQRISCGWPHGPHPASSRARCNQSQSSEVYDLFLVVPNVRSRCPGVELAGLMAYLNIFQILLFQTTSSTLISLAWEYECSEIIRLMSSLSSYVYTD